MNRREMIGVLGVTAAGVAAANGAEAFAQERQRKEGQKPHAGHAEAAQKIAETCSDCMTACNKGFHHCHEKSEDGKKDYGQAAHACVDCAEVCASAAALCGRASSMASHICAACAECCDDCVATCEKLNDAEMKEMLDACRKTSKACREMAKASGHNQRQTTAN